MGRDWTIDTNVLYVAAELDMDAVEFLMLIRREKDIITLDFEGHIEGEYQNCFASIRSSRKPGGEFVKKWFKIIVAKGVQKFSGRLPAKGRHQLRKLRFDQSDWPFVAVCAQTESKCLVSEDSDYTDAIKQFLGEDMKVAVLRIRDSLNLT